MDHKTLSATKYFARPKDGAYGQRWKLDPVSLVSPRRPARPAAPPLGLRERKKADVKRRIAEAAIGLVRERGYDAATIDEIARRADVSQPTFYAYYPSKDAILREHAVSGFRPLIAEELERDGTIVARMRRYLRSIARRISADRRVWYAIAVSNAYNPVRDPDLLRASDASTRVVEAVIAEGQRRGEFTQAFSSERLASLLEGVMFRVCLEWSARFPDEHPLERAVDEGFELFLRAAEPRPGDGSRKARARRKEKA
jgi:AcrR family transcriptional regulator